MAPCSGDWCLLRCQPRRRRWQCALKYEEGCVITSYHHGMGIYYCNLGYAAIPSLLVGGIGDCIGQAVDFRAKEFVCATQSLSIWTNYLPIHGFPKIGRSNRLMVKVTIVYASDFGAFSAWPRP